MSRGRDFRYTQCDLQFEMHFKVQHRMISSSFLIVRAHPECCPCRMEKNCEVETSLCLLFKSVFHATRLTPPAFLGLPTKDVKCNKFLILLRTPLHYAPLR
jgi:hypothetical protein